MHLSETKVKVAYDLEAGKQLREIADEIGLTPERIRQIRVELRQHVDEVELALLAASKTGEVWACMVPNGPDRQTALLYFDYVERNVEFSVEHRPTVEGSVFFLVPTTSEEGDNK